MIRVKETVTAEGFAVNPLKRIAWLVCCLMMVAAGVGTKSA